MATLSQVSAAFTQVATDATQAATDTSDTTGATTQSDLNTLTTDLKTATDLLTEYIQGQLDSTATDGETTASIDTAADESNESNSD